MNISPSPEPYGFEHRCICSLSRWLYCWQS